MELTSAIDSIMIVSSDDRAFLTHRKPMAKAADNASAHLFVVCRDTGHIDKISALGYNVIALKKRTNRINLFTILLTIHELVDIYRKVKPDIIHHSSLYVSFLGSTASLFVKGPKIITAITGVGYLFSSSSVKASAIRLLLTPLLRFLWSRPNHSSLFQNQDDRELFAQSRLCAQHVRIIPGSGVDIKKFIPAKRTQYKTNKKIIIGCASRLLKDKGLEELVRAISLLPDHLDIKLNIAGTIDPKNPSSFTQQEIEKWKQNPKVKLLGQITDMVTFWQGCDMAILPSHREGLPKSLLEAAACGLPLLGADVAGTRELIEDGVNGLLFTKGQKDKIAEAITVLSKDKLFLKRAGLASRQKIEREGFSDQAVEANYREFLLSIQNRA